MTLPLRIQNRKNYFDDKLKFQYHIENVCKNASLKLSALSRVAPFADLPQKKILFNAFFQSQFSYCPLVWTCHSKTLNNKINRLHERCLRLIYNDKHCSTIPLDWSVFIHTRNLQLLVTEMYKSAKGMSPKIMQEIFRFRNRG